MFLSAFATVASAGPTADKKKRESLESELARGAKDVKDCGKSFKLAFDWAVFDAVDWAKSKTSKDDQLGTEHENVRWVGHDLNELCQDKDYKAALQKIDSVVYRVTPDATGGNLRVKVEGKTIVIWNLIGWGSRSGGDYASAVKKVL
jgi:hypothetical protein